MCLEIESEAKNFTKFSLKVLGFFSAIGRFFLIFSRFLVIFQRLPRIGRPIEFSRPNPSGRALVALPRMPFKRCYSSSTHSRPHSRLILSSSLNPPPPKHLTIFFFLPSHPNHSKPQVFLHHFSLVKKPQFLLNPNCIKLQLVDHGTQGRFKEERKGAYSREFTSPFWLFPGILLLKPSKGIQLEPSLLE